ncbi:MAG: hypothetical protein HRT73_01260, partial [Flavobacteriales bacterium]|nr:hypothetical protein [Flavobacteriales bacterium]
SGNQSDAIYWMGKAIQLNPNYQVLYQKIIRYLNQTGQEEKAQQYQQLELNKFSGN